MTVEQDDSLPTVTSILPEDVESDTNSCYSDCSSVYSVGNFLLVSDADNEEDGDNRSFTTDMVEEILEEQIADIIDEELSLIVAECFEDSQLLTTSMETSMDISIPAYHDTQTSMEIIPARPASSVEVIPTCHNTYSSMEITPACPDNHSSCPDNHSSTPACPDNHSSTPACPDNHSSTPDFLDNHSSTPACPDPQAVTPVCHDTQPLTLAHCDTQSLSNRSTPLCPGYTIVIDNIDMNVRRSYQRLDRTTNSYHFCHGYAVLNRVNSTDLPDGPQMGILSPELILPNQEDLDNVISDFTTLVSRYCLYI